MRNNRKKGGKEDVYSRKGKESWSVFCDLYLKNWPEELNIGTARERAVFSETRTKLKKQYVF